jgi:translation initiation factor 2 beta subunit (eIF-2beta)/eIF-5
MDSYFYCSYCCLEMPSEDCVLADILEKPSGRMYVFECSRCGGIESSELIEEYKEITTK